MSVQKRRRVTLCEVARRRGSVGVDRFWLRSWVSVWTRCGGRWNSFSVTTRVPFGVSRRETILEDRRAVTGKRDCKGEAVVFGAGVTVEVSGFATGQVMGTGRWSRNF